MASGSEAARQGEERRSVPLRTRAWAAAALESPSLHAPPPFVARPAVALQPLNRLIETE